MLAPLGLAFILSQFFRSAVAVIAPELRQDLGLAATELGVLSGALFLGAAIMQLPVGIFLDRFGPRRTITSLLLVTGVAALSVQWVTSLPQAAIAWFFLGVGISPIFTGILVLLSRWMPRDRFALATSVATAVSGGGVLLSATPLAAAATWVGWRGAFAGFGVLTLVLAGAVWATTRDAPPDYPTPARPTENLRDVILGVREVLAERRIYNIVALVAANFGILLTVRGLWIGPFLSDVHGLDPIARGNVILAMSVAWVLSSLIYGPLDRFFDTRRGIVTVGSVLVAGSLALLAINGAPVLWQTTLASMILGVAAAFNGIICAHARTFFADHLFGRVVTTVNVNVWGGLIALQVLTGAVLDVFPTADDGSPSLLAYRAVFGVLAVLMLVALVAYRRLEDAPPSLDGAVAERR